MLFGNVKRRLHRSILSTQVLTRLFLVATFGFAALGPAHAREPDGVRRDIAALLRSSKSLRIGIVGDSVAGDLANGMRKILQEGGNLAVVKFTKPATGLMRDDVYDWPRALETFLGKTKLDIVAVMIGGNDRQAIWMKGSRLSPGTKEWRAEYRRRLARFMDILSKEKAKVYWIGLPPVRAPKMSRDHKALNQIFRAEAKLHGFAYVSIWDVFTDANGRYTSFGRDSDGTRRRLRKNDGMHFTIPGELRLARTVAGAIGRDLGETKSSH